MKKLFAFLLVAMLALSLSAYAAAEDALPEPFVHITFDGEDEGYTALYLTPDKGDNDGATYGLATLSDPDYIYTNGPVGNCIYLNGKYGLDLGFQPTDTDAYTISFWVNADRLSDYGPTLQLGHNIGKASDAGNDVTWLNVTQTNFTPKYFPTIWSRNEASDSAEGTDCWPWMASFSEQGQVEGKREWAMITIVCSGEPQVGPSTGAATVGAQLYINGELRYDSNDNYNNGTYFEYSWDATLAPNIMKAHDNFEAYFGINYWDTVFKGFLDDLYVFDSALNAEQVMSLYQLGDASVQSVKPEAAPVTVIVPDVPGPVPVVITGTQLGAADYSTGWWSEFSDIWAVAAGESKTVSFTNYHNGSQASNWHNFLAILQSTSEGHSPETEGYSEYAVVRADNWGWGAGYDGIVTPESNWNWDTYATDMDGASVNLTVTNNGGTADVSAKVTTTTGAEYYQNYNGIIVDGDLYFCLTVENACLDIIETPDAQDSTAEEPAAEAPAAEAPAAEAPAAEAPAAEAPAAEAPAAEAPAAE